MTNSSGSPMLSAKPAGTPSARSVELLTMYIENKWRRTISPANPSPGPAEPTFLGSVCDRGGYVVGLPNRHNL